MKRVVVFVAALALLGGPALAQQGFNPKPGASSKKVMKAGGKKTSKTMVRPSGTPTPSKYNR
jgi:hypothetical protein